MAESDETKLVRQKMDAALDESKKTGKQVNVDIPNINKAKPEGSWTRNMKRVDKDRFFKEGEGVGSILDATAKKNRDNEQDCGNFRIKEKNLIKSEKDGEEDRYEYKFEWDEKFAQYARAAINKADDEPLTPEEIDVFCLNILVAQQKDELVDGVKVREREQRKDRFYKEGEGVESILKAKDKKRSENETEEKRRKFYKKY